MMWIYFEEGTMAKISIAMDYRSFSEFSVWKLYKSSSLVIIEVVWVWGGTCLSPLRGSDPWGP